MFRKTQTQGFSVVVPIVAVFVMAAIGFAGWRVFADKDDNKNTNNNSTNPSQQANNNTQQPRDQYEGWKSYSNTAYRVNFRYPMSWRIDEISAQPSSDSAIKREYAINIKRNEEVKYNNTIAIEVLDEPLDRAATWYDKYFAQSSSNKVTRTTNQLKGKQSVQYVVTHLDGKTKLYLFSVDGKSYLVTSINEWLNVQNDTEYWTKFDKVLESLQIT